MSPLLVLLPSEILIKILSYLPLQSLLVSLQTCKTIKGIYDTSTSLQYLAELEVAGMLDNPYCPLDTTQRLLMLRQREEAWWCLEPQLTTLLNVHAKFSGLYDVSSSALLLGLDVSEYHLEGTTVVQSFALPSPSIPPSDIGRHLFEAPYEPVNIGISIEENDLVALVVRKHERQLAIMLKRHSTGKPHELAQRQTVLLTHVGQLEDTAIEIAGSNLVLTTNTMGGAGVIRVYDWMRGILKGVNFVEDAQGIIFLTDGLFLTPNAITNTLDIFHIPSLSTDTHMDTHTPLKCILKLALPPSPSQDELLSNRIQCRCSPNPTAGGHFPRYTAKDRPFAYDPDGAIAIFVLEIQGQPHPDIPFQPRPQRVRMFARRSDLLNLLPSFWKDALLDTSHAHDHLVGGGGGHRWQPGSIEDIRSYMYTGRPANFTNEACNAIFGTIAWESWGPACTRIVESTPTSSSTEEPTLGPSGFITSTAGERFVQSVPRSPQAAPQNGTDNNHNETSTTTTATNELVVIDFNKYRVQKVVRDSPGVPSRLFQKAKMNQLEMHVKLTPPKGFGDFPARQKLPMLRIREVGGPGVMSMNGFSQVIVDEQRIIGIKGPEEDDGIFACIEKLVVAYFG